jgi:Fe-S protein assembly co-chaperone HscB
MEQEIIDYFSLLGLKRQFDLDLHQLKQHYHQALRHTHPDRFAQTSSLEQRAALLQSATLNEAFQTLQNPIKRMAYWLHLYGINPGTHRSVLSTPQLMQQMEWRERLEKNQNAEQVISEVHQTWEQTWQIWNQTCQHWQDPDSALLSDSEKINALQLFQTLLFLDKLRKTAQLKSEPFVDDLNHRENNPQKQGTP